MEKFDYRAATAIALSKKNGEQLARDFPGIVDDWTRDMTAAQIAEKYDVPNRYGGNSANANSAVHRALDILLEKEEKQKHGRRHNSNHGKRLQREGRGAFGLSEEKRSSVSSRAGKKTQRKLGRITYDVDEVEDILRLSQDPNYQHGSRVKTGEIAAYINQKYGRDRTSKAISLLLGRFRPSPYETRRTLSDEERKTIIKLSEDPIYQRGVRFKTGKIAEEVNRLFHDGIVVIKSKLVSRILTAERKKSD